MKHAVGKHLLLIVILLIGMFAVKAQTFLGLRGSPYGGVTNVDYNPAIANNMFQFDINLIAVSATVNNNYIGLNRQALLKPSLFASPEFMGTMLHERINGNDKNIYAGTQITGPLSFMFSFGKKKDRNKNAIAFTYHSNIMANADNISETLARVAYYGLGSRAESVTQFLGKGLSNTNLALNAAAWNDYGITYSRVILDNGTDLIKVGGTLKLLEPMMGVHLYSPNLSYKWPEYDLLNINRTSVSYAYSQGLITSQGYSGQSVVSNLPAYLSNALAYKNGAPTVAADMGAIYEWRPYKNEYTDELDCRGLWTANVRHYKLAAGFSIIDFGALRFNRGVSSENFYANIQGWNVTNGSYTGGLQSLDDTIHSRFQAEPGKNYFTIWLPTRFNIFVDYFIKNNFGVTGAVMVSQDMSPAFNMLQQVTTFSITPKYDSKWFGFYLPVSYDVMGNFSLGATVRVGPLIIGTQDLLGLFLKKYVYNADIHAALKITIPHHRIHHRYDMRFRPKDSEG